MMNVDYKQFKAIRISALLLATTGVVLATLIGGFLLVYVAHLPAFVAFCICYFFTYRRSNRNSYNYK